MDDPLTLSLFECYYDSSAVNWDRLNTEVTVDPDRFGPCWQLNGRYFWLVGFSCELASIPQRDAYYYHSCDVYGRSDQPMAWLVFGIVFGGYREGSSCPVPRVRKEHGCQSSAGSPKPAI